MSLSTCPRTQSLPVASRQSFSHSFCSCRMKPLTRIFARQASDLPPSKYGSPETLQQQILRLSSDIGQVRDKLGTKISWGQGAGLICGCSIATLAGMAGLISDLKADVKTIQNHLITGNMKKVHPQLTSWIMQSTSISSAWNFAPNNVFAK